LVDLVLGFEGGLDETYSALVKLLEDFDDSITIQELIPKMVLQHKLETIKILLGTIAWQESSLCVTAK
jgi:hypothetical protein